MQSVTYLIVEFICLQDNSFSIWPSCLTKLTPVILHVLPRKSHFHYTCLFKVWWFCQTCMCNSQEMIVFLFNRESLFHLFVVLGHMYLLKFHAALWTCIDLFCFSFQLHYYNIIRDFFVKAAIFELLGELQCKKYPLNYFWYN